MPGHFGNVGEGSLADESSRSGTVVLDSSLCFKDQYRCSSFMFYLKHKRGRAPLTPIYYLLLIQEMGESRGPKKWDVVKVTNSLRWESIEMCVEGPSTLLCCIPFIWKNLYIIGALTQTLNLLWICTTLQNNSRSLEARMRDSFVVRIWMTCFPTPRMILVTKKNIIHEDSNRLLPPHLI